MSLARCWLYLGHAGCQLECVCGVPHPSCSSFAPRAASLLAAALLLVQTTKSMLLRGPSGLAVQDPEVVSPYVTIQATSASGYQATLRLSPDHFMPVAPASAEPVFSQTSMKRGQDVSPSDTLFLVDGMGHLVPANITTVSVELASGAFNPYTASGTIVVGQVVASVHSKWVLDVMFDRLGWTSSLPGAYQVTRLAIR